MRNGNDTRATAMASSTFGRDETVSWPATFDGARRDRYATVVCETCSMVSIGEEIENSTFEGKLLAGLTVATLSHITLTKPLLSEVGASLEPRLEVRAKLSFDAVSTEGTEQATASNVVDERLVVVIEQDGVVLSRNEREPKTCDLIRADDVGDLRDFAGKLPRAVELT